MQPFTATLQLAGRTVTVRELSMLDFRGLLFGDEIAATEAAAVEQSTPVADTLADTEAEAPDTPVAQLADNFLAGWLKGYLGERGITFALIHVMSSATQADLMQARFSEIDVLIAKIKTLNAPFFELFQRQARAAERMDGANTDQATQAPPPTPAPELPPINASASSDPLLHSLGMAIQAHGATATPFLIPPSTNSSTH